MNEVVHNYQDAAVFPREYQAYFATRADGSPWPNWETTWQRGAQYFRGLIRLGNTKSIAGIASVVDIKQHLGADEFQGRSWDGFHRNQEQGACSQACLQRRSMTRLSGSDRNSIDVNSTSCRGILLNAV
jgi:hypothetical protein